MRCEGHCQHIRKIPSYQSYDTSRSYKPAHADSAIHNISASWACEQSYKISVSSYQHNWSRPEPNNALHQYITEGNPVSMPVNQHKFAENYNDR